MQGNTLEKGPHSENDDTAVSDRSRGRQEPDYSTLDIRDNSFTNDMSKPTSFVH